MTAQRRRGVGRGNNSCKTKQTDVTKTHDGSSPMITVKTPRVETPLTLLLSLWLVVKSGTI